MENLIKTNLDVYIDPNISETRSEYNGKFDKGHFSR